MELLVRPTADHAVRLVARLVADRLRAEPGLVSGCATGRTIERVYPKLVQAHLDGRLTLAGCRTSNPDEYVGWTPDDPRSHHAYRGEHLFKSVDIGPRNTFLPDGTAADLGAEVRRHEERIVGLGGIGLGGINPQLLGLGKTRHIGFNEPPSSLRLRLGRPHLHGGAGSATAPPPSG